MAAPKDEKCIYVAAITDLETGGRDATKCAITQITTQMMRLDTFEIIGTFDKYIYPYHKKIKTSAAAKKKRLVSKHEMDAEEEQIGDLYDYEEKALAVTDISMDLLYDKGEPIQDVFKAWIQFLADHTITQSKQSLPYLIGQNITFDISFILQGLDYTDTMSDFKKVFIGNEFTFGSNKIWVPRYFDTLPFFQAVYANDKNVLGHDLTTLCELNDLENEGAHNSLFDVEVTGQLAAIAFSKVRSGKDGEFVVEKKEKERIHFKI